MEAILQDVEQTAFEELLQKLEDRTTHLSFSSLKAFRQSPQHFLRYKLREFKSTKAMDEGSVIDIVLTEPEAIDKKILILPDDCKLNSKAGVEAYCHELGIVYTESNMRDQAKIVQAALEKEERIIINQDIFDKCENVANKVRLNPASGWLFDQDNEFQVPVNFKDLGWNFKGMIDAEMPNICRADGKKMADSSYQAVRRTVRKMWYDGQAAIYSHRDPMPYYVVAYDMQGNVSVTELKQATIDMAWEEVVKTVDKLDECIWHNQWHRSYDFHAWSESGIYSF